jgi:hypothetical protein
MSASLHESSTAGPPRIEAVADGVFAYIQPDGTWWIDLRAALADMVTYNGGRPLTCLA